MEEKNDWCAHGKPRKAKKVHRFLQYGRKKKMIDVHAVNKNKKQKKYIDSYVHAVNKKKQRFNQPITSTSHLIWFLFSAWNIFCQAHITPKSPTSILFCLFILQFVIKGKARQVPFVFLFFLLCLRIRIASPHNIRSSDCSVTLLLCFSVHNWGS